jgi:hypothetical protein
MAIYYIDGTSGNDANAGTTPATAWQTLEKAILSGNGSTSSFNTWILLSDTTLDYFQLGASGSKLIYAHISSNSTTKRRIEVSSSNTTTVSARYYGSLNFIDYERIAGDAYTGFSYFFGSVLNSRIANYSSIANSYFVLNSNFINCLFETNNSGALHFDDSELSYSFNKCNFNSCKLNTSTFLADDRVSVSFTRCIINKCVNDLDSSNMFSNSREMSWGFTNCSIELNANQNFIKPGTLTGTNIPFLSIDECVIQGQSGGTNYIVDVNNDYDYYVTLLNSVLFRCVTHNPIYNIEVDNITTSLATNYEGTDFTVPATYFTLEADSPARTYTSALDAGAVQNLPPNTSTDPGIANVRAGTAYNISGVDYVGTLDIDTEANLPDPSEVLLLVTYGENNDIIGTFDPACPVSTDPGVENVRFGTAYQINDVVKAGTLNIDDEANLPAETDVRDGVVYGASLNQSGLLDINDEANLPDEDEVQVGIQYGKDLPFTGTLDVDTASNPPAETDVRDGQTYGSANQFTGSLDLPSVNDVRDGVLYDNSTKEGNLALPSVDDVRLTIGFGTNGTEFTGTVRVPDEINVRALYKYDANDSKTGTANTYKNPPGYVPLKVATSDGSNISTSLPFPAATIYIIEGDLVDNAFIANNIPERLANVGEVTIEIDGDNELLKVAVLERG